MKIYFAGSIRGGRDDTDLYHQIIEHLKKYGTVLTEHLGNKTITHIGEAMTSSEIYIRDMVWNDEANVVVAEVSTPSLGVGYEIGRAESRQKKILCLYRPQENKRLSAMIAGNKNIMVQEYRTIPEVYKIIDDFFSN